MLGDDPMTFTTWKVLPSKSGWAIRSWQDESYESRHQDKEAAIWEAKRLAQENPPAQVVVHATDGSVTGAVHYNASMDEAEPSPGSPTSPTRRVKAGPS